MNKKIGGWGGGWVSDAISDVTRSSEKDCPTSTELSDRVQVAKNFFGQETENKRVNGPFSKYFYSLG
jgi:hypothetical protein